MAKWGIFEQNDLRNIALTDSEKDSLIENRITYVAKTLTDDQANNALNEKKDLKLNGDTIVESDVDIADYNTTAEKSRDILEFWIKNSIIRITHFLTSNGNHSDFSEWQNVKNQLEAIDLSGVTFPTNVSPQEWFSSQSGHSSKKMLQLP
jgi:hypothetical protein